MTTSQRLQMRRSNTPGYAPPNTPGTALPGELLVNMPDGAAWLGQADGTPKLIIPPAQKSSVFVGGTNGWSALTSAAASAKTLATGRASLYLHYSVVPSSFSAGTLAQIVANFAARKPFMAELGLFNPNFFAAGHEFDTYFTAAGAQFDRANVNLPPGNLSVSGDPSVSANLAAFKAFVDAGRARGVTTMAPFVTPNTSPGIAGWDQPDWALAREACTYGGGVAIDAPASFFLGNRSISRASNRAYQQFIIQQLQWAKANGLRSSVVVSPWFDVFGDFLTQARRLYAALLAANALPTEWVIENYDLADISGGQPTPSAAAHVGVEDTPGTIMETGRWFAEFAATRTDRVAHGDMAGQSSAALGPLTITGKVDDRGYPVLQPSGLTMSWNYTSGRGEAAFLCGGGAGRGGATFYAVDSTGTVLREAFDLDPLGNTTQPGASHVGGLTVDGAASVGSLTVRGSGNLTVGGVASVGSIQIGSLNTTDYVGTGAPALDLGVGSSYRRVDGAPGSVFYVKRSAGLSGWYAVC